MRKIISWEGKEKVPRIIFELGSLRWDDGPIPLVWNFKHDVKSMLGSASDLRREADGSISAELVFNETDQGQQARSLNEHGDISFTTWSNELIWKRDKGKKLIHSAHIQSVSAVLRDQVGWE